MNQSTAQEISPRSFIKRIFVSQLGLRSGWSLTLFLCIYAALTLSAQFSFVKIPALRNWAARQPHGVISAVGLIQFTGLELTILLVSIVVTGKIEKRSFRYYGLSVAGRVRTRIFSGMAFGFGMASILIGLIAAMGGFSLRGPVIDGVTILSNGLLYGIGFSLAGLFEELTFRGFMQTTPERHWSMACSRHPFVGIWSGSFAEFRRSLDGRMSRSVFWNTGCIFDSADG